MKQIALDDIVIDAGTQVRAAINEEQVNTYAERMQAGDVFPAAVLFHDGNGYYIGDGFHRIHAAGRIGLETIGAEVRKGTRQDALWFALAANKKNGIPLTSTDKRHAILLALKEWPDKSGNQIAEQIGVNQRYFASVKAEVSATTNLPPRVTGKDGKSYPASRAQKPSAPAVHDDPPGPEIELEHEPEPQPDYTGHQTARRTPLPPSNGLQFARLAIMRLEEIRNDDLERQQAFTLVRRWLDARNA